MNKTEEWRKKVYSWKECPENSLCGTVFVHDRTHVLYKESEGENVTQLVKHLPSSTRPNVQTIP
jgi:hypothetical protein